jgi:deoxyribonuclease-4
MFEYADEWGCQCAQTYITLSRTWSVQDLGSEDIISFRSAWQKSRVREVVAHVPFIVNLASPDDMVWEKSVHRLSIEVSRSARLGIRFLVLHPGSHKDSGNEAGIDRIIAALDRVMESLNEFAPKILLETAAGQGTAIGHRFEEIASILNGVRKRQSLGTCLDTCHVFAAGYDIRGYDGYAEVLRELDTTIGLDTIGVIHLNDSKTELGSRIDRHAFIGQGKLGIQAFHGFVKDVRFLTTPMVLELPEKDPERVKETLRLLWELESTSEPVPEPRGM